MPTFTKVNLIYVIYGLNYITSLINKNNSHHKLSWCQS